MSRRGFHTVTLGCKLNQFDGSAIEGELMRRGLERRETPDDAAVVVINTCTVTHRADAEARRLIRRVRRRNPECCLLVTGCFAEREPETIRALGGVDRVFGNRDKPELPSILDDLGIRGPGHPPTSRRLARLAGGATDRGCDGTLGLPEALHFGDRSRAFLRVQEGCRLSCSYCIIPEVRGPSRSVPPHKIETAMISLFDAGYHEVVLTGVNTGDYGRDLEPCIDLATLLRRLLVRCSGRRIRLNSLEPLTVTDEIVELMASGGRLAPHLQVPLQSGSAEILRRMRRNYRLQTYADRLARLREAIPEIGLGADVIVGFPGETETAFRETLDFIASSPLNYLHVFAWSARPGTPAARFPDRVHSAEIRQRSTRLRALGSKLSRDFRERFLGQELEAVILSLPESRRPGRALTGNFIEVAFTAGEPAPGGLMKLRVDRVDRETTHATLTSRPAGRLPERASR